MYSFSHSRFSDCHFAEIIVNFPNFLPFLISGRKCNVKIDEFFYTSLRKPYAQLVTLYDVTSPGAAAVVQEAGQLGVRPAGDAV